LLAPLVLMFVVIVSNAEIRHCAEWASLPIGAESRRFT
jgi:hypothetical protein